MKSRNIPILAVAAALAATALLFSVDNPTKNETADTIYHGGPIITIDDSQMVSVVEIKDGKMHFVLIGAPDGDPGLDFIKG